MPRDDFPEADGVTYGELQACFIADQLRAHHPRIYGRDIRRYMKAWHDLTPEQKRRYTYEKVDA